MLKIQQLVMVILQLAQEIFEILRSVRNLEELEERIQLSTQKAARTLLTEALEQIDMQLAGQRNQTTLKNVGMRNRTINTSLGEITFRRRLYQEIQTGQHHFLLDETLGLRARERVSPRLTKLLLELGTEMPFRRAAQVLDYIVPGVSAMTVWQATRSAGVNASTQTNHLRRAVFEQGLVPQGRKAICELFIEADGVMVRQQHSTRRHEEVKLVVAYEGKEGTRHRLVNRRTVAGLTDGEGIWEEASVDFGHNWSLDEIERVRIGGDGAQWIKGGLATFPQASYHLDPFHLRKRLTEALAFNSDYYEGVIKALGKLDQEGTQSVLDKALRNTCGAAKKRIKALKSYLLDNWQGIADLPEAERLGAIEGQVRHTLARRMKRIGARWSPPGTDYMARLLAAKANGELERYCVKTNTINQDALQKAVGVTAIKPWDGVKGKGQQAWLEATVPALKGPFAGKPWVKNVLRTLTSIRWSIA